MFINLWTVSFSFFSCIGERDSFYAVRVRKFQSKLLCKSYRWKSVRRCLWRENVLWKWVHLLHRRLEWKLWYLYLKESSCEEKKTCKITIDTPVMFQPYVPLWKVLKCISLWISQIRGCSNKWNLIFHKITGKLLKILESNFGVFLISYHKLT